MPSKTEAYSSTHAENNVENHESQVHHLGCPPPEQATTFNDSPDSGRQTTGVGDSPVSSNLSISGRVEAPASQYAAPRTRITPPDKLVTDEALHRRSTRKRKTVTNYEPDSDTSLGTPVKQISTSQNLPLSTTRKLQPLRGNWSPDFLLRNFKSRLATTNLVDLLSNEKAWTSLSHDQQLHLISLVPGASVPSDMPADLPLPNILKQVLKTNLSFQADVRLFQEDLAAGRYDPKWLSDAQAAMDKRAAGRFDTWKEQNREQFWGQKQKTDYMALAGESSQHSLPSLVAGNCFAVGDVWRLKRGLKGSRSKEKERATQKVKSIVVEKDAIITDISAENLLTFSFPPGQFQSSSDTTGADVVVSGVDGPIALSNAILNEDGRIIGVRGANSWKEFRCFRKNQDMGSLFDVRELFHQRTRSNISKRVTSPAALPIVEESEMVDELSPST